MSRICAISARDNYLEKGERFSMVDLLRIIKCQGRQKSF
jgi:hypothetical protein